MDSFNMMSPANPMNPMNPMSPISIWDDDEPVREAVRCTTEAACNTGGDATLAVLLVIVGIATIVGMIILSRI